MYRYIDMVGRGRMWHKAGNVMGGVFFYKKKKRPKIHLRAKSGVLPRGTSFIGVLDR